VLREITKVLTKRRAAHEGTFHVQNLAPWFMRCHPKNKNNPVEEATLSLCRRRLTCKLAHPYDFPIKFVLRFKKWFNSAFAGGVPRCVIRCYSGQRMHCRWACLGLHIAQAPTIALLINVWCALFYLGIMWQQIVPVINCRFTFLDHLPACFSCRTNAFRYF